MDGRMIAQAGKYLTFFLHDQCMGIPIQQIREINRAGAITPVPQAPEFVLGVINLRGHIVPVVDLRKRLGLPAAAFGRETCVVVIETEHAQVGAVVNSVREVIELSREQIEPPPNVGQVDGGGINGVGKSAEAVVLLLDISQLFHEQDLRAVLNASRQAQAVQQ